MSPKADPRVAIVTGAGRGIGRGIALRLARDGTEVVVNDIDAAAGRETAELITKAGGHAIAVVADVAVEGDVTRLMDEVIARFGQLDILVNNAGIDAVGTVEEMSFPEWQRLHSVDLGGAFLCAKYAVPHLVRSPGASIVNISSIHAFAAQPARAAYAAAKAGLLGLTKALAVELGPTGVRVNAIIPGYIRTDIWSEWLDQTGSPEETIRRISLQHPLRRVGQPADIAGAVAFLISADAGFITGATLTVDGGLTSTFEPPPLNP